MPRQRLGRRLNAAVVGWALAAAVLDATTKWWARHALGAHARHVWGPLWWRLTYNSGVSFSFTGGGPVATTLVVFVIVLVVLAAALRATPGLATVGLGLLLGGGASNEVDRLVHSPNQVTDFISVGWFPVFNLADAAVTVGFVILVIAMLRGSPLVQR